MIVSLGEEFDTISGDEWSPYIAAIENLLIAHVQGWHMLILSRSALYSLLALNTFSDRQRAVLEVYIGERLATLTGQAASVGKKIVCTREAQLTVGDSPVDIFIPLKTFDDLENCFKSVLLVENSVTDGNFYVKLAKLMSSNGQMMLPLEFEFSNGGGSTTAAQVGRLVERPRPVLVLVDSDKGHPTDREGDTARQVRAAFDDPRIKPMHKLIVIPVRSVENFIPVALGASVMVGKPASIEICAALTTLDQLEVEQGIEAVNSAITYMNMKKGIKLGSFRKGKAEFRQSVQALMALLGVHVEFPADNDNRRDDEIIVPGVHNRFLEHFLEALEGDDFGATCKDAFKASRFSSVFGAMLNEVISYGMSAGRIPVSISNAA